MEDWASSTEDWQHIQGRELFPGYPTGILEFAAACCILFMLIGIPGNLITIIALLRYKKVHNATTVFIVNLTFSDLMFCCFNLPLAASMFIEKNWIHGETLCILFPLFRYGLVAVSLFSVLGITINRYVMIGHPQYYPRIYQPRYLAFKIAMTWIASFGLLIPTLLGKWGRFGLDIDIGSCSILPVNKKTPKEFLFIASFAIPCLIIVLCYARIFWIVKKAQERAKRPPEGKTLPAVPKKNGDRSMVTSSENESQDKVPKVTYTSDSQCNGDLVTSECDLTKQEWDPTSQEDVSMVTEGGLHGNNNMKKTASFLSIPGTMTPVHQNSQLRGARSVDNLGHSGEDAGQGLLNKEKCVSNSSINSNMKVSIINLSRRRFTEIGGARLSSKDKRLLKVILAIFLGFLVCYLPITLVKAFSTEDDLPVVSTMGYILIYLTTCINPIIYVAMSSEYRQAYRNLFTCSSRPEHSRSHTSKSQP